MESIVFEHSPIAQYLEAEGQPKDLWAPTRPDSEPTSPTSAISFAPRGLSTIHHKTRKRPPRLKLEGPPLKGVIARLHGKCSRAFYGRLGWTEHALFLEQFRYVIVASQLLSDHSNPNSYKRQRPTTASKDELSPWKLDQSFVPSSTGLLVTVVVAFAVAWSIRWLRNKATTRYNPTAWLLLLLAVAVLLTTSYLFFRYRWLHYLRIQAVKSASSLVSNAQEFDAAALACIALIQEVELVSRGYNICNPLAPVTRLEETVQVKRCSRLRRTIHKTLITMFSPYFEANQTLKPHAVELDLEKYYDIYEISRTDMEDTESVATLDSSNIGHASTLQDLKIGLQRLHTLRKLFLCTLLALSADGSKSDLQSWLCASNAMTHVSSLTAKMTCNIDEIMEEEEDFQTPPTPKVPLTPGRERMRSQMRQLGNLSQGIRGLQAKMRLLRDESDKVLERSDEFSESGTNLLAQYDSIGGDLKDLVQEWEVGRAALAINLDKKDHRRSLSTVSNAPPTSPALSLGGATAVEGSPQNGLNPTNDPFKSGRSRSSTSTSSSGEEIFEAIALPRQRITLTREERIEKLKEERARQAIAKENSHTNTHMLKELETVIKLRPRGRTMGRLTSV